MYFKKNILLLICLLGLASEAVALEGEKRMFMITGYYSPLPDQSFYVTGDYDSEIRLNGRGIRGADGTGVFPGMIAAPRNYAFGTTICLPNFGCGRVHDRGGAIVNKGQRNLAVHDRLDLWLGYGEEGLLRALQLGAWETEGTLYQPGSGVEVAVNFSQVTPLAQILELPDRILFEHNLAEGREGGLVVALQEALRDLGYYSHEINGVYGRYTASAVLDFQLKNFVIINSTDAGNSVFGPQTREKLGMVLHKKRTQKAIAAHWADFHFEENLAKGARDADVLRLQELLVQHEFLEHRPTGYFGKLTKAALVEFQLGEGIIEDHDDRGAGTVGPQTRAYLNEILASQKALLKAEYLEIVLYRKHQKKLNFIAGRRSGLNFVQK